MKRLIVLFTVAALAAFVSATATPAGQGGTDALGPGVVPRPGQAVQQRDSAASTAGSITFDDYAVNTYITDQYKTMGVVFDGCYIELDNLPSIIFLSKENESYPTPYGNGANAAPITATFEAPTGFVEADAIYLDAGSSMVIDVYDQAGAKIGSNSGTGRVRVEAAGIRKAIFSFVPGGTLDDIAGIDNLAFGASLAAAFKERGTKYGWDDFTDPKVPAKSVRKGYTDTVRAEITPPESFASCYFDSSDESRVTVSPEVAASANQVVTVKGIAKGASDIEAANEDGTDVYASMNACTYNNRKKVVAVTLVHKKGTGKKDPGYKSKNITDSSIKSMMAKIYKQSVTEWTIVRLPAKTVAFDINKDGKLDVESWMSDEMKIIRNACKSKHQYNIFLVSHPTDGSCGFMDFNQKYGFVHADTCGDSNTVAHELGHGQGLAHTPDDINNLMYNYHVDTRLRLRKAQWDKVNP